MKPEQWQKVKRILEVALEREPGERKAYLDEACAETSVRREVESLIAAHEQAHSSFLTSSDLAKEPVVGDRLGSYEILERIGAGGMGVVYRARDTRLGRAVALKILPPEMVRDRERLARFQREARSVAALNHPHIVTHQSISRNPRTNVVLTSRRVENHAYQDCERHHRNTTLSRSYQSSLQCLLLVLGVLRLPVMEAGL